MSISEAIREHPELVKKYLGSVVPVDRQLLCDAELRGLHRRFLRLRAKGRSLPDGTVDLFPHQREEHRPVRAHADHLPRKGLTSLYLEGCTAPQRDENQLHAAVVELVALDDAEIKYSTVQNWYPGDKEGKGGIYNFVTKRWRLPRQEFQDFLDPGRNRFRRSPGNIRPASCAATVRAASSTRSPCRTATSRSTVAPR